MAKDGSKNNKPYIGVNPNSVYVTFPSSITWGGVTGNVVFEDMKKFVTPTNTLPHVKQIIFSNPMTTVIWADDTKTQVECKHGDVFDESVGFALCVTKKLYGHELYTRLMNRAKRQY